ncbi:unnamed protein product [Prunus armeniaca]
MISKEPRSRSRQVVSAEKTSNDLTGCSRVLHNDSDSSSSVVEEDRAKIQSHQLRSTHYFHQPTSTYYCTLNLDMWAKRSSMINPTGWALNMRVVTFFPT